MCEFRDTPKIVNAFKMGAALPGMNTPAVCSAARGGSSGLPTIST
jgi:hypothetical protein